MIVDTSAALAIIQNEPDGPALFAEAATADCKMSAATWVELGIVSDARSATRGRQMDELLEVLAVEVVPLTVPQARVARAAYRRYGRGSGSPARLNYGDCFSYALSIVTGEPLLFIGRDFIHTDVVPALRR